MDAFSSIDKTNKKNIYLQIGGYFSLAFAVFQVFGFLFPPSVIAYFGGPVKLRIEHPALFALLCVALGVFIVSAGLYALSGAGKFRKLPFVRTVLVFLTSVFILRGLMILPLIRFMMIHPEINIVRYFVFSLIALCAGIIHLIGTIRFFKYGYPEK